ncbi:pyruvate ferredoxin oxidoreductase [Methanocella sp. CWC-04]|uniref:pyruvate synthase n=1 Tax=Methanooceanicella nereidis TaxID=2052831 RepID=A0AAP2RG37_9EURY|nr:pyruvate ferredoxin oxidoreductase subunit gamma [Methanocella sp. CWC-04]MCD1295955.1 pyruvate ferredoxin oxidoreductase [Methanocella sp. CWC-04]
MKEIRIHGRGGQGSVTAAELIAVAAFEDGKWSQAFPYFGTERRGAPVTAFARISDSQIRIRSQIYQPDYVIVQDPSLIHSVDVASGIKDDGLILINSDKKPSEIGINTKAKIKTIDATSLALEVIGLPIVNTALLGAFAGATGMIRLESVNKAIKARFPGKVGDKNVEAVKRAFELMAR